MILNMNQLRAFYFAAKIRSITKAAQELMVTPPTVTMQIKQLEKTLGIRLMFRDGNSIRLTEIGMPVFSKADTIFENIKELVRQDKGASFLEKFAVEEDLKNESLKSVCILEGSPTIEFGIGYLQRNYLSPAAWAFLRLLEKQKDILATPK